MGILLAAVLFCHVPTCVLVVTRPRTRVHTPSYMRAKLAFSHTRVHIPTQAAGAAAVSPAARAFVPVLGWKDAFKPLVSEPR